MAKKIEIINNSLVISDTITLDVISDIPKDLVYYKLSKLVGEYIISIFVVGNLVNNINTPPAILLSDAVDHRGVAFTTSSFIKFAHDNLGNLNNLKVKLSKNDLGLDAWGRPKISIDNSIFHGMFTHNVPVASWYEIINDVVQVDIINSISVNGALHIQSGAALNDKTVLRTYRNPRYEPNRGYLYSTSSIIDNPEALQTRRFGVGTSESGTFFSLESGVLYGVIRTTRDSITYDDKIPIDTTGIDLTKGNTFDIQFQWRGVGDYIFFINLKEVANSKYLGKLSNLSMFNPANPIFFESINLGDNNIMKFGCVDVTSEGGKDNGKTYGSVSISNLSGQVSITGYNVPVIAIRSKAVVNGLINTRDTLALLASAYSDNKSILRIWATRDFTAITPNDQLWKDFGDGHLEYIEYNNPNVVTPMTFDTTKATLIFGCRVGADLTYATSALFNGRANIYLTPSDMFIFTMHRENGISANVGVTFEFAEEI